MGLKLELTVILAIISIVFVTINVEFDSSKKSFTKLTKEIDFFNTTITEVDRDRMQGKSYATYGLRDNNILFLKEIVYISDKIEYIYAKNGKMKGDILYLDNSVQLQENNGYLYTADHIEYNQKKEILHINSDFIASNHANNIKGKKLFYNMKKKDMLCSEVVAQFTTLKGK